MAKYGKLSSAGKLVYLTMSTRKWPPAQNWAHDRLRRSGHSFFSFFLRGRREKKEANSWIIVTANCEKKRGHENRNGN